MLTDTLTCGLEEPGIKPPVFLMEKEPLYLYGNKQQHLLYIWNEGRNAFKVHFSVVVADSGVNQ